MRAALVIPGGPKYPDPAVIDRHQLDRLFYDARTVTRSFFDELRTAGRPIPGIQVDPAWFPGITAAQLAEYASQRCKDLGAPTVEPLPVLFDIETHDMGYVLDWHARWRQLRWKRETYWTCEPLQGGLMDIRVATMVNADANLRLCVQLYLGTPRMFPVSERAAFENVRMAGIAEPKICSFYDAERGPFPQGGDGITYNFDALAG